MRCRHGYFVLALMTGLLASAGCLRWQCFMPTMHVEGAPAPNAHPGGELTPVQAAQLCLTAGEALEKKGFLAEAILQYENARSHDPQARGVARRLAILYDLQGEPSRAEAEYRRAMQEQTRDGELLNDFGYFHYRHNHLQEAENWLRIAVTLDPNCQCAWVNLGQVLACQGRDDESYRAFARVLRPAEAYSNLGVLLAKQGRNAEARRALEQALALDPGLQQPRAFLNALTGTPGPLPPGITGKTPPAPTLTAKPSTPVPLPAPILVEAPKPAVPLAPKPAVPLLLPQTQVQVPPKSNPAPAVTGPSLFPPLTACPTVAPRPVSELPSIVTRPTQPAPMTPRPALLQAVQLSPAMPAKSSIVSKAPPAPPAPPPPPPPPPFAPPSSQKEEGPILIRTSAIEVQPAVPASSSSAQKLLPLPLKPASVPLTPKAAPQKSAPSAPPRAVLTDCQSEPEKQEAK